MLHKFFIKRFRMYALIMLIPLLLLFILMGYLSIDAQQEEFKKQGVNTLSSINENVINVIYSSINQQDVIMRSAQFELSMKKLLSHDQMEYRDGIFMSDIINFLKSYETSYKYINSIYLYMDGLDNFLTSSSDELVTFRTYYDIGWLEIYKNMPFDSTRFVETRKLQRFTYDKTRNVITFFRRLSYAKGVVVMNVDSNNFGERIDTVLNPGQSFFFLNNNGEILYGSDKETTLDVDSQETLFANITDNFMKKGKFAYNQKWITLNNKKYLFYIQPDDYNQTFLVSLISHDVFAARIFEYVKLVIAILLINFLIVMLLAWITTKSAFKHITYLVNVFSAAERGETIKEPQPIVKDEYNLILNNVLFLFIKNNQMQANLTEKQHQNQIAELMALQLQINPHFIFNTLQTMDLEVLKQLGGQSTLHTLIQELSSIMKYALTNPTESVTLNEEMNYLKAYLEIQEVRFQNNIVIYYEVDEALLDISVFRLMLQPIVENCVNHGIKSTSTRCCIKIKVNKRNEDLCVAIIDSGCGMTKQELSELKIKINDSKSKNIGLTNINRRLILHYSEYSRLYIRSKKDMGTVVSFKIPIKATEEKLI